MLKLHHLVKNNKKSTIHSWTSLSNKNSTTTPKFYILVLQPKSDLQVWQPIGLLVSACASNFSECFLASVAGNCLCQCARYQQLSMCGELLSKSRICLTALLIFNKSTSTAQPPPTLHRYVFRTRQMMLPYRLMVTY